MEIIIGSEGMGFWSRIYIDYILKKIGYNKIEWKNIDECNAIVSSHNLNREPRWNNNKKIYIYWSGESFTPPKSKNELKYLNILSTIEKNLTNYIYLPYFLFSPHLYKKRKYSNINRKYLLAYCHSNKVNQREKIFDLFVEKMGYNLCHAYGKNYGSYKESKKNKIKGGWDGNEIIEKYKEYKFVIAMENKCKKGYITEKILNAFYSGAIPIYWGCDTVNKFFNKKAFINVNDYESFEDCVNYVCNMSDKDITKMSNEKIYFENNELLNIFNTKNNKNNKILEYHIDSIKNILNLKK